MLAFLNALSPWHLLLIGIVAILLFGNRLPEVARSLGRSVNEFKRGLKEVKEDFDEAVNEDVPREKLGPPPDEEDIEKAKTETKAKEPSEPSESRTQ
jgi:sec-independent protein translocase protein TatA